MKKFLLIAFILVDIALLGGTAVFMKGYIKRKWPMKRSDAKAAAPASTDFYTSTSTVKIGTTATDSSAIAASDSNVRKILFSYRNSKATQVSIRSDFTGWKAEPMVKGKSGAWEYMAHLTPGEYAYCFTVGDKIINDPANKRTKVIGRTTVSSIVVNALPAKAAK